MSYLEALVYVAAMEFIPQIVHAELARWLYDMNCIICGLGCDPELSHLLCELDNVLFPP